MTDTAARIAAGDIRVAARLITAIERGDDGLEPVLADLWRRGGQARLIGITGPPGVGKSTLTTRLIHDLRAQGQSVAVLAVDPSSPQHGGAVLGDRVRMLDHAGDARVFIRSMSARGAFGGLSRAAGDALVVMEAMGFDVVLVETVGVGQTEVEIADLCPCVLLLHSPASGDGVQAIKAGVTEIASLHVVTRAEAGDVRPLLAGLREAAMLRHALDPGAFIPPVVIADAVNGAGMDDLHAAIAARFDWLHAHPDRACAEEEARIRARVLLAQRARAERQLRLDPKTAAGITAVRLRQRSPGELLAPQPGDS